MPDPKDGTLYALGDGTNGIKKLPFTIPQLVAASPCKSNEGILYTGRHLYVDYTFTYVVPDITGNVMKTIMRLKSAISLFTCNKIVTYNVCY